jgi:thioredoxin 1
MKKIALFSVIALLHSSAVFAGGKNSAPLIGMALASGRPTIIDFGAGFCIPCKKMKPILESLDREYRGRANVVFVDINEEQGIGDKYRVQMIPTQVFYDGKGKEVTRHIGFMDKKEIVKVFKELGVK